LAQVFGKLSPALGQEAVLQVDAELEVIFGHSGKQVLVKEFEGRYGVSLRDAVERPDDFKAALFCLLGELGSTLVMGRISKRVGRSSLLRPRLTVA